MSKSWDDIIKEREGKKRKTWEEIQRARGYEPVPLEQQKTQDFNFKFNQPQSLFLPDPSFKLSPDNSLSTPGPTNTPSPMSTPGPAQTNTYPQPQTTPGPVVTLSPYEQAVAENQGRPLDSRQINLLPTYKPSANPTPGALPFKRDPNNVKPSTGENIPRISEFDGENKPADWSKMNAVSEPVPVFVRKPDGSIHYYEAKGTEKDENGREYYKVSDAFGEDVPYTRVYTDEVKFPEELTPEEIDNFKNTIAIEEAKREKMGKVAQSSFDNKPGYVKVLDKYIDRAAKGYAFQKPSNIEPANLTTGNKFLDTAADIGGFVTGLKGPGGIGMGSVYGQIGEQAGMRIGTNVVPRLTKILPESIRRTATNMGIKTVENAANFGSMGMTEAISEGKDPMEVLKQTASYAAAGGMGGIISKALPSKVVNALEKNMIGRSLLRGHEGGSNFGTFGAVQVLEQGGTAKEVMEGFLTGYATGFVFDNVMYGGGKTVGIINDKWNVEPGHKKFAEFIEGQYYLIENAGKYEGAKTAKESLDRMIEATNQNIVFAEKQASRRFGQSKQNINSYIEELRLGKAKMITLKDNVAEYEEITPTESKETMRSLLEQNPVSELKSEGQPVDSAPTNKVNLRSETKTENKGNFEPSKAMPKISKETVLKNNKVVDVYSSEIDGKKYSAESEAGVKMQLNEYIANRDIVPAMRIAKFGQRNNIILTGINKENKPLVKELKSKGFAFDSKNNEWRVRNSKTLEEYAKDVVKNNLPAIKMDDRTINSVGDRKVNAYQFDHPEVKDHVQSYAGMILSKEFVNNMTLERSGEVMAKIRESVGSSSAYDIKKGLENIIKDEGSENTAVAKRIELVIDDMLTNGFTSVSGEEYPADTEYLAKKSKIEGREVKPLKNTLPGEELPVGEMRVAKAVENNIPKKTNFPELKDNYRKPLKTYSDTLYRETSIGEATHFVDRNSVSDLSHDMYFSNAKELAKGQGINKGVVIELNSNEDIHGSVNRSKPTWEFSYKNNQAEFIANNPQYSYIKAVKSITISPEATKYATKGEILRLKRVLSTWEKIKNEDGSITYLKPTSEKNDSSIESLGGVNNENLHTGERKGQPGISEKSGSDVSIAERILRKAQSRLEKVTGEKQNAKIVQGLNSKQRQVQEFLTKFGYDVSFYDGEFSAYGTFDPENPNVLLVKKDTDTNMLWAVGHEFFHGLKVNHPDLYKEVLDVLEDTITEEQVNKYSDALYEKDMDRDAILEEMLADEAGNSFINPTFWDKVLEKSQELFDKLVDLVRKIFAKAEKIRYKNFFTPKQIDTFRTQFEDVIVKVQERVEKGEVKAKTGELAGIKFSANKGITEELKETIPEYNNNEEVLKIAEAAIKDLKEIENSNSILSTGRKLPTTSGIRTLGKGISSELVQKGYINIKGRKINSVQDIAEISQVFRDPRYETMRIVFVNNKNKVVGYEGITSRMPSTASTMLNAPNPKDFHDQSDYKIAFYSAMHKHFNDYKGKMNRLKATGYYLVHNHPSGNPTPSNEDIKATSQYQDRLSGFLGHIIVNSGKFAVIDPTLEQKVLPLDKPQIEMLLTPSVEHPLLGKVINGATATANIIKAVQTSDDYSTIIFSNVKGVITGIQEVPNGMFKNNQVNGYLRNSAVEFGAGWMFVGTNDSSVWEKVESLVRNNYLMDGVFLEPNFSMSAREKGISPQTKDWMGKASTSSKRVFEGQSEYDEGQPLFSLRKRELERIPTTYTKKDSDVSLSSEIVPGGKTFVDQDLKPFLSTGIDVLVDTWKRATGLLVPRVGVPERALGAVMKSLGDLNKQTFELEQTMLTYKRMFNRMPEEKRIEFLDKYKRGEKQSNKELQKIADFYKAADTARYNELVRYKPSLTYKENHFRIFWKTIPGKPENKGFLGASRRPLQGTKGFMKHATLTDVSEGIAKGGVPISTNPQVLFELGQTDTLKFIAVQRMWQELKAMGFAKFVRIGGKVPEGYTVLNDSIARVYIDPNIPVKEAYDEKIFNGLNDLVKSLGLQHYRNVKVRGTNTWGLASPSGKIITKFAGPETVLTHEIGHHLEWKYKIMDRLMELHDIKIGHDIKKELRDLADLRYEGKEQFVTEYYKKYVRNKDEKIANLVHAYVHARELLHGVAPLSEDVLHDIITKNPELHSLRDIKPSLVLGSRMSTVNAGGIVQTGNWYVEENTARILNNYLSRDYIRESSIGRAAMAIKNVTTAMELAISPFHLMFEAVESVSSQMGVGMLRIVNQGILQGNAKAAVKGLKEIVTSPLAWYGLARIGGKVIKLTRGQEEFIKSAGGKKFLKSFPEAAEIIGYLFEGGGKLAMHEDYKIKTLTTFVENVKSHNYIGAALRLFPTFNQVLMKPLFEMYIPRLKIGLFFKEFAQQLEQLNDDILEGKTTKGKIARQTWDSVENRFGEMNFDTLFWNRTFKTAMQLTFRSVTWKLGNIRGMGGAVFGQAKEFTEPFRFAKDDAGGYKYAGRVPRMTPKMAWAMGLAFTTAIMSSIIMLAFKGEMPSELLDYVFPRIGQKDKNGNEIRLSLPTYARDAFSLFRDPRAYVTNSMSGVLSKLIDSYENRDYFGNFIYDPEDPEYKKLIAVIKYSFPVPFSATQYKEMSNSDATTSVKMLSMLAFNKAPKEYILSDFQKELAKAYERQMPQNPLTPSEQEDSQEKRLLKEKIKNNTVTMDDLITAVRSGLVKEKGLTTFVKNARLNTVQIMWKYLAKEEKQRLLPLASEDEIRMILEYEASKQN